MVTHVGNSWGRCYFDPWWKFEHRDLNYLHEPFNDTATQRKWWDLGFENQRFTGDLYDMRFVEPAFVNGFRDAIDLDHFSWSVYRMSPGTVLPEHGDTYARFCEIYSVTDIDSIMRYVVFLEPWQSGHYFEIDSVAITGWTAGDAVWWIGSTPHVAANIGKTDRYTLQITGVR
jgi:hypothetical protein